MKKIVLLGFFLCVLFSLFLVKAVSATSSAVSVCLQAVYCHPDPEVAKQRNQKVAERLKVPFVDNSACVVKHGHRVQLSSDPIDKPKANSDVFVAECFSYVPLGSTTPVRKCTTGNSGLDREIFNVDNFTSLRDDLGYSLDHADGYGIFRVNANRTVQKIGPTKLRTDASGNIPVLEWQSFTPQGNEREWRAARIMDASDTGSPDIGQKQAQFDALSAGKACVSIAWDPEGRVFDSSSLEPIPTTRVTLLKKYDDEFRDARETEVGIAYPYVTVQDGKYNFVVQDGIYKLTVSALNYTFPITATDVSRINPGFNRIYRNIYPALTGEEIIQDQYRSEQDFKTPHRDIPLYPVNNPSGYRYPLKIYSASISKDSSGNAVFKGLLSHPFVSITVYSLKNNSRYKKFTTTFRADKDGVFSFSLPTKDLEPGEAYGDLEFVKTILTVGVTPTRAPTIGAKVLEFFKSLVGEVFAQQDSGSVSLRFEPILSHIEGYAYDASGKIMPNATVGVYVSYSERPTFETKADAQGYFKISSENLPGEQYVLRYSGQNGVLVKTPTSKFLTQNNQYILDKKIRVYASDTDTVKPAPDKQPGGSAGSITPSKAAGAIGGNTSSSGNGSVPFVAQQQGQTQMPQSQLFVLIGIILLVLVGVVGGVLGFYLLKKRSEQQFPQV